ncbi:acyl-CoA dehydrogenase family protein [Streptomyces sp. NPDC090053]|uniref:acyl-CoA dehydrogenase family protein n=1 Tax=Streptomyces sp. NPDC090053 TaxID=3365932 RepID=UPI0037FC6FD7
MNLEWSAEQLALHNRLREHGGSPAPGQSGGGGASWQALAADQVMALPVPVEYGGLGHSALTCAFALEGLGYGCRDIGLLVSAGAHMWAVQHPIVKFGTPQQKATYLPGLASGTLTGAHAITETETGSDALAMEAVAVKDGTKYRLSGRKRFVTNAPLADVFLVYATLGQQFGFTGVTAFLVERDHPGLKVEAEYQKAGLRSCPWGQVVLDDCVVDESRRLGAEKQGSKIFASVMAWERTLLLAPLLGAVEAQLEECVQRSLSRRQFRRRIASFQSVSNRIVDLRVRLESARNVTYRAAWELADNEESFYPEMVKLAISEAAVATFEGAMQIFGGYGYTEEAGIEERLRDALGTRISSGTSDMQRSVIAAKLGMR